MGLAILFLISQIIFGIALLYRRDGGLYIQDIRVFFLCVFSLYSLSFPSVCYFGLIDSFNENLITNVTLQYGLALLAFNIANIIYKVKFKTSIGIDYNNINSNILFLILIFFLTFQLFHMLSAGITVFKFGDDMSSRTDVGNAMNQLWVVLSFLIISLFDYLIFNYKGLSRQKRLFLIITFILYVLFQASIGNRREFAGIVFFLLCFYLIKKRSTLKPKYLIIILVLFSAAFYLSTLRDENTRHLKGDKAIELMLASNEFIYPMQTTYFIMRDNWDLRYGSTYVLLPFQVIIPREIYPDKPSTLGAEFVSKTFGNGSMGYAYTPVSEAYLNFGAIGPFVMFFLFSLFFNWIIKKQQQKFKFYYFVLYGLIFDFCRGDVASIVYAFLCIYFVGFNLYKSISRFKL